MHVQAGDDGDGDDAVEDVEEGGVGWGTVSRGSGCAVRVGVGGGGVSPL